MKKLNGFSNIFYLQKPGEKKSLTVIIPFAFSRLKTLEKLLDSMLENGWRFKSLRFGFIFIFKHCRPKKEKHMILLTVCRRGKSELFPGEVLRKDIPSFRSDNPYYNEFLHNTFFFSHLGVSYYYYFYRFEHLDDDIRNMGRQKRKRKEIMEKFFCYFFLFVYLISIMCVLIMPDFDNRLQSLFGLTFVTIGLIITMILKGHEETER